MARLSLEQFEGTSLGRLFVRYEILSRKLAQKPSDALWKDTEAARISLIEMIIDCMESDLVE